MTNKEQIARQTKQVEKTIGAHGFDFKGIDYSLGQILVLKAMQAGIEDPYKWAVEQGEKLNDATLGLEV